MTILISLWFTVKAGTTECFGIVAAKLVERFGKPTSRFCRSKAILPAARQGVLKGLICLKD